MFQAARIFLDERDSFFPIDFNIVYVYIPLLCYYFALSGCVGPNSGLTSINVLLIETLKKSVEKLYMCKLGRCSVIL